VSLQKAGIFHHKTLGMDFDIAATRARHWNAKLKAHRLSVNGVKPTLSVINLMSVAYLLREFEASPRFARYSPRTREDYSYIYRHVETHIIDGQRMFDVVPISEVTRQMVYTLYEKYVTAHGNDSTNKTTTACQAAFNYGTLKFTGMSINPFTHLGASRSLPRRRRWIDEELETFINKATEMGYSSVGRLASE
jgi:hypothetical protein